MKRSGPPKRKAWLTRRKPINKVNRARKAERFDRQFGKQAELARSLPCCVCSRQPTEAAHVRSRGAGGTARDIVPLCSACHSRQHAVGIKTFQDEAGVDLAAVAAELAEEVRRGQ